MENQNAYFRYTKKTWKKEKNLPKKTMKKLQTIIKAFFKNEKNVTKEKQLLKEK